jgi:hypothetical protein
MLGMSEEIQNAQGAKNAERMHAPEGPRNFRLTQAGIEFTVRNNELVRIHAPEINGPELRRFKLIFQSDDFTIEFTNGRLTKLAAHINSDGLSGLRVDDD